MKQILIIGAGPAGSTAGILLARAGFSVTIIEQQRFPRDKVCGECLSSLGIDVLSRLRLSADVQHLHPVPLHRSILFDQHGHAQQIELPRPMWGISRIAFDQWLLEAARQAGAQVLQPARAERIEAGHRVKVWLIEPNEMQLLATDQIIIADGKAALLGEAPPRTSDFGLKAHFVNVDAPRDAIELFGVRGHYGGIAPIEDGRWNIAFSIPKSRLRASGGDLDRLFARVISENPTLKAQMHGAERTTEWLASPLPRFGVRRTWPPQVIPVGNAAAAVEPIGGEGMGLAMRSAELAAEHLINSTDIAALRREYRKLWKVRRPASRAVAKIVSSPALARLATPMVRMDVDLTSLALRALGKAPRRAAARP